MIFGSPLTFQVYLCCIWRKPDSINGKGNF